MVYCPPVHPAQDGRLNSRYGLRRSGNGANYGQLRGHSGIDFTPRNGFPFAGGALRAKVFSVCPATLYAIGTDDAPRGAYSGYGNCVVMAHSGADVGTWSLYAHLDSFSPAVGSFAAVASAGRSGLVLPAGTWIGNMGNTSTGRFSPFQGESVAAYRARRRAEGLERVTLMIRHLHFEIRRRRPDGSSPFPGAYGDYNLDPEVWLRERGIDYQGALPVLTPGRAQLPPLLDSDIRLPGFLT